MMLVAAHALPCSAAARQRRRVGLGLLALALASTLASPSFAAEDPISWAQLEGWPGFEARATEHEAPEAVGSASVEASREPDGSVRVRFVREEQWVEFHLQGPEDANLEPGLHLDSACGSDGTLGTPNAGSFAWLIPDFGAPFQVIEVDGVYRLVQPATANLRSAIGPCTFGGFDLTRLEIDEVGELESLSVDFAYRYADGTERFGRVRYRVPADDTPPPADAPAQGFGDLLGELDPSLDATGRLDIVTQSAARLDQIVVTIEIANAPPGVVPNPGYGLSTSVVSTSSIWFVGEVLSPEAGRESAAGSLPLGPHRAETSGPPPSEDASKATPSAPRRSPPGPSPIDAPPSAPVPPPPIALAPPSPSTPSTPAGSDEALRAEPLEAAREPADLSPASSLGGREAPSAATAFEPAPTEARPSESGRDDNATRDPATRGGSSRSGAADRSPSPPLALTEESAKDRAGTNASPAPSEASGVPGRTRTRAGAPRRPQTQTADGWLEQGRALLGEALRDLHRWLALGSEARNSAPSVTHEPSRARTSVGGASP